jgi:hypothetical protein
MQAQEMSPMPAHDDVFPGWMHSLIHGLVRLVFCMLLVLGAAWARPDSTLIPLVILALYLFLP